MSLSFEKEDRNLILFILGCMGSLGSVFIYTQLITTEIWNYLGFMATTVPMLLLVGGFFTSVYFYRRSLITNEVAK